MQQTPVWGYCSIQTKRNYMSEFCSEFWNYSGGENNIITQASKLTSIITYYY